MKFYIVQIGEVMLCPPVLNLMRMLGNRGIKTILVSTESKFFVEEKFQNVELRVIPVDYEGNKGLINKIKELLPVRKSVWKCIDTDYEENDVIWLTSNTALKYAGNRITKYNYVLQLMELSEELKYHPKFPVRFDAHKIGNESLAVIVPEYNRAHILQSWWNLNERPLILSNKPFQEKVIEPNTHIEDDYAREVLKFLEGKRIMLYQGIIHKERPLDKYIYAVDKLGDDYAFIVMSNGENIYKNINSRNFYFIPFIAPPKHLQVTSHAHIGVLSYFPVKGDYSILNALYCAPNKTFEYSMFGMPMIGNDNPGLKYIFDTNHAGITVENFEIDDICDAVKRIESEYDKYSEGAVKYYNSVDSEQELTVILDSITGKLKVR